jgi:single-stranded DNA-binding protein
MNNCILMVEIVQEPELRYTSDNQTAIAEMLVQFSGLRAEDPPATLKVVGWGNLAQEIQQSYHQGDRVIVEGRLSMNTVERPEGFKEKRAELTVQRIHPLSGGVSIGSSVTAASDVSSPARDLREGQTTQTRPAATAPSNTKSSGIGASRAPETEERGRGVSVLPQDEPPQARPQPKTPPAPTYPTTDTDIDDIPF